MRLAENETEHIPHLDIKIAKLYLVYEQIICKETNQHGLVMNWMEIKIQIIAKIT